MDVRKELSLSSIELVRSFPFYGHILVQLPRIFLSGDNSQGIPTLGVGKDSKDEVLIKLYINEKYVTNCYQEHGQKKAFAHLIEVCKHEILHIVFGHLCLDLPDRVRAAVAVDLSVNSYVTKDKIISTIDPETKMPKSQGCFAEDYNLEVKKSAMWYYNQLLNNKKFKEQCESGAFGLKGILSDVVDRHGLWKKAQEDPMLKEMMKDLVRKSAKLCKETNKWGDIPSDLLEQIDELSKHGRAILPWQQILRLFISSAMDTVLNYTMKRRSKRFDTRPGIRKDEILNLAIGIDSSGSVSNEQLKIFFNEMFWIQKNGCNIVVFECDCSIQREYPYSQFDGKVRGRGGTDLEPVLKEVENRKFDALIYFTDFYAPKVSRRYNIPVLWVLSNCEMERAEFPYAWGQHIHIKGDLTVEMAD